MRFQLPDVKTFIPLYLPLFLILSFAEWARGSMVCFSRYSGSSLWKGEVRWGWSVSTYHSYLHGLFIIHN